MTPSRRSARRLRVGLSLAGVVLVAGSATAAADARSHAAARVDRLLTRTAADHAQQIAGELATARNTILLLAQNPAFSEIADTIATVEAGGTLTEPQKAELARHRTQANLALAYLETLFPDQIGEACVIADTGRELARVVDRRPARVDELSVSETHTPFFAETIALAPGEVHREAPYVSPDTGQWVVAQSTPLPLAHRGTAFVHFELTLRGFATRLGTVAGSDQATEQIVDGAVTVRIVDRRTGVVIADSAGRVYPDGTERAQLRWLVDDVGSGGLRTASGIHFASAAASSASSDRDADSGTDGNDWLVVASAKPGPWLTDGLVGAPLWLALAGVMLLIAAIVTSRVYERYLERVAHHDALTGLANRRRLNDALGDFDNGARRACTLLVDLDRFKDVNDTYGHEVGDALLLAVGERLLGHSAPEDLVARLGGDEFAVLVQRPLTDEEHADHARRLHTVLLQPFLLGDLRVDLEASIGVAIASPHECRGAELLHRADQAMYTAKQLRLGVEVHRDGHESAGQRQLILLGELRDAIEGHQLVVQFQPKVAFADGSPAGMEALVRWQHPERGMLPPSEFVEFAERTSLMRALTMEVVELTLTQIRRWLDDGIRMKVAVNVSTRTLLDETFADWINQALRRHGCDASLLQIEVTESTMMHDPDRALAVLRHLGRLGVEVSIDDFGTGYSSLSYLTNLGAREVKIDRSFVARLCTDEASATVVDSIISLGHSLGMRVVAEGVEDAETARRLVDAGCDVGQGFLWSRPASADEALAATARNPLSPSSA